MKQAARSKLLFALWVMALGCNGVLGIPAAQLRQSPDACAFPADCGSAGSGARGDAGRDGAAGDAGSDQEAGVAGSEAGAAGDDSAAGTAGQSGAAAHGGAGAGAGTEAGQSGSAGAGSGANAGHGGGGMGSLPQTLHCDADDRECNGLTPLTCEDGKLTLAAAACEYGCKSGECFGECTADARACDGQEHRVCDAELTWQRTTCSSVCDVQQGCIGQCQPGQRQCDGMQLQECSELGEYTAVMTCANACLVVAGTAQCVGCTANDGMCPAGCVSPMDNDCPRELGESCSAGSQCRQGQCVDGVCCNSACSDACFSCSQADSLGSCRAQSFDNDESNCGSCGARCSSAHIAAACSGGTCNGSCESGFGDCNNNKRSDGCEVDLRSRPDHCGACGGVCQYGVCSAGSCAFDRWGLYDAGPSSERRSANALMGMKLQIARAGRLVALGMQTVIGAGDVSVRIRYGLYADSGGVPQNLIAQTDVLQTVHGATEGAITPVSIAAGEYWFFFLAEAAPRIATETVNAQWATRDVDFGPLPSNAPGLALPTLARADVYAVTVP